MTDYRRVNATYDVDTKKTRISLSKPFERLEEDKQLEILEIMISDLMKMHKKKCSERLEFLTIDEVNT